MIIRQTFALDPVNTPQGLATLVTVPLYDDVAAGGAPTGAVQIID